MDRYCHKTAPVDGSEDMALPIDSAQKFKKMVQDDTMAAALQEAYSYVKTKALTAPLLISGPVHTKESIREKMSADAKGSVTASSTLMDMNLDADAVATLDVARIQWVLANHTTVHALKGCIGTITVNWDSADELGKSVQRLDKDAEIQALCLLILWTDGHKALLDVAADLVFKYVHAGLGSSKKAYTLRLIDEEEGKRKVRINTHQRGIHSIAPHISPGRGRC